MKYHGITRLRLTTCLCCLVLLGSFSASGVEADLESRLESFTADMNAITSASNDEHDWRDYGDVLKATYRRWFPDETLGTLMEGATRTELTRFFYKTFDYLIYVGRKSEWIKLEVVFEHLEGKGWADQEAVEAMHKYYLTFRLFDQAHAFRQKYPDHGLPASPPIVPLSSAATDDARTALGFINHGSALERQVIDLQSAAKVVIIGHPHCHFSQDAVAAITADPELSTAMSTAGIWLTPPSASLTDGDIVEWNQVYPEFAYRYVEFKSDWPEVNYWGTPSFYFMKNGRLVKKVIGWPSDSVEERKEALRAGLRAIGAWGGETEKKGRQ